jgi:excisionase family DNA binding protein
MAGERLLTVTEVAQQLRLNPRTIRRWIAAGRLPAIDLGSDRAGYRICASAVAALLGEGAQKSSPPE